jgi:hypothetical protein
VNGHVITLNLPIISKGDSIGNKRNKRKSKQSGGRRPQESQAESRGRRRQGCGTPSSRINPSAAVSDKNSSYYVPYAYSSLTIHMGCQKYKAAQEKMTSVERHLEQASANLPREE